MLIIEYIGILRTKKIKNVEVTVYCLSQSVCKDLYFLDSHWIRPDTVTDDLNFPTVTNFPTYSTVDHLDLSNLRYFDLDSESCMILTIMFDFSLILYIAVNET